MNLAILSHVRPSDATLEAEVNLHEAGAGAYYQFQIVKNPSEYGTEIVCPSTRPQTVDGCVGPQEPGAPPIGFLPGNTAQPGATLLASLELGGAGITLSSGTTYHYRVLVARRVQTEDTIQWEPPTVFGADQTFTTPPAPSIESESVSHITPTDATIEAQINTGGRETTYEVWAGNYPECIEEREQACDSSSTHPIVGTIAAGSSSPASISVDVAKAWHALSPGSSYIYHVDATNSNWAFVGSAHGENKVFKTAGASPPTIESESLSHLTSTDATLEAQINTEGLETTYTFYLQGPYPGCLDADPPCMIFERAPVVVGSGELLGSFVGQSVSVDLNSAGITLQPGGHYRYSVTATSAAGTIGGAGQRFIAPEEAAQPLTKTAPSTTTSGNSQPGITSTPTGSGGSTSGPGVTPHGPQIVCLCDCSLGCHGKKARATHLSRVQKLAKALKACAKKPKSKRAACRKQAHKKYGPATRKSNKR